LANESKAAREYLTLIRVFEQLRALGYDGSHDAVQRYTKARQKDRAYNRRLPLRRISKLTPWVALLRSRDISK
jgi:hypothetical protein